METRSNHILVGSVTLLLLAAVVGFTIWIAGLAGGVTKKYDIFFMQSVEGLAKGSSVSFNGVPIGQVAEIVVWKPNPELVRVRISVKEDTPILQGTTASLQASFTGPSSLLLDGAGKGAAEIVQIGRAGVPEIPTKRSGLGALLNNAPQLVERLSTLTERLTELLNDKNQKAFGSILNNVDTVTGQLAAASPDMRAAVADARVAVKQAGDAAKQIALLADKTGTLVNDEGKPMVEDLRKTAAQAQKSLANLDAAINDVRPGLQAISTQTVPEIGQLVKDLRVMSDSLTAVATKIDQGGASALLGSPALPDYKPERKK
jgi:phospholipid/cholesterol/gamma-HCH transport system substrate-binding protein